MLCYNTFLCNVDSVGPVLSLLSRHFLYFDDPNGSNTNASPKRISAKTTQLNTTIAENVIQKF